MYTNIFDSHCHYDDAKFDGKREETLTHIFENGVRYFIHAATDIKSSEYGIAQAEKYKNAYTSIGIHPECCDNIPENYIDTLRKMTQNPKVVAIGEIGLDYYWTKDTKDIQKVLLKEQIKLANELQLPVIIHSREATQDCNEILKKYRPKGVIHCFSGSAETAKELLSLGFYISFTGVITFSNSKKAQEALMVVPDDRLLLETDCPYMAPVPMRGSICTSDMIAYSAEKIAELKGMDTQTLIDKCTENTKTLFNIK